MSNSDRALTSSSTVWYTSKMLEKSVREASTWIQETVSSKRDESDEEVQKLAGTRTASGRRRPARDHAFIAYRRVPSPPPGTTPAPNEDVFTSAVWGVVVSGGPVGQTRFGLGSGRSRCSLIPPLQLSPSRSSRTDSHVRSCRATRDRVSPNAAGRPCRGGPPVVESESHPSGESSDTGPRRPGGSLPRRGRRCTAGPSRPVRAEGQVGRIKRNVLWKGGRTEIRA